MMTQLKKEINEYLFFEFGVEGDESRISEEWPFILNKAGEIDGEEIFEFNSDNEAYYAIYGRRLRYLRKDGTIDDLKIEFIGSSWIARQKPITLDESFGDHPKIPRAIDRRKKN